MAIEPRKKVEGGVGMQFTVDLRPEWSKVMEDVGRVEQHSFEPLVASSALGFDADRKKSEFLLCAVLRDEAGIVVGYCWVERRWPDTAYISRTAIEPKHRDSGGLGTLIEAVEAELREQGYAYIERDCRTPNGYADKVARHYGDRVVVSYEHASWTAAPLRFFRIRL